MASRAGAKKAPLRKRDPYRYYRNAYYALQGSEWACLAAPVAAVFGVKWNEYFVFVEGGSGVSLTVGCVLALVMAAVFAYRKLRHQEKAEGKVTMLSYAVGLGVAFVFAYLFKVVIDDLALILGCEFAGAVAAYGVDFATREARRKMVVFRESKERLEAEEAARRSSKGDYV